MALVNSNKILKKALKGGYAVGAFNIYNLETAQAVVSAAEEKCSDAIIAVSEGAGAFAGFENLFAIVNALTKKSKQDFALHLDHGTSFEACKTAIDAGFTSVMIDASSLSFEENVKLTKRVVDYAHKKNVSVEAELGRLIGTEDMISSTAEHFTNPEEARLFVQSTGIDSLAISMGTAHGINKGTTTPCIRFDVIECVSKAIPSTPLVAHGSSSVPKTFVDMINKNGGAITKSQGISTDALKQMAKTNICKINTDTDIRLAFTAGVRETLTCDQSVFDPRKYLKVARANAKAQIMDAIDLFSGK